MAFVAYIYLLTILVSGLNDRGSYAGSLQTYAMCIDSLSCPFAFRNIAKTVTISELESHTRTILYGGLTFEMYILSSSSGFDIQAVI